MQPLTENDVTEFMSHRLELAVVEVEVLTGGEWSQAFGLRAGDQELVVRFGNHRDDFEKDQAGHRFNGPYLPVPKVLEIGDAFGGYFCISERIHGEMIDDIDAPRMTDMIPAVLDMLDALREADFSTWAAEVGEPSCSWPEQLLSVDEENERVFGWHDRIASSPTGDGPYKFGLTYLRDHIQACPDLSHITHNDLLHNNVLVVDDRISGVIDWGCAGRGDFLYELAMFTFYAPWFPSMSGIDWKKEAERHYTELGLRVEDLDLRLRCYEVHLALSGMAWSSFKENWTEVEANARRMIELIR